MRLKPQLATLLVLIVGAAPSAVLAQQPSTFTVYAQGLNAPRGLAFGPDRNLYVAEAGTGGSNQTDSATCLQVPAPVGPYSGGSNGRISKISPSHTVTTVASGFPSAQDALGDLMGVADVKFIDGTLYALIAAGGCEHGNPGTPNGVAKVDRNTGKWTMIADVSAFLKAHPAKFTAADDFEGNGTPYSMIVVDGALVVVEANHGQVLAIDPRGGAIKQLIDISAFEGHIVPTSIAERHGTFYVGNLNLFPIDPDWARVLTISAADFDDDFGLAPGFGQKRGFRVAGSKAGFTTVVDLAFGPDGLLYALELSDGPGFPAIGAGKVVRVKRSGEIEEVITGLNVPTGMTFGPDGRLYVSDFGAAPAPLFGAGRVLQFDMPPGW